MRRWVSDKGLVFRAVVAICVVSLASTIILQVFFKKEGFDLIVAWQSRHSGFETMLFQIISDFKSVVSLGIPFVIFVYGVISKNRAVKEKAVILFVTVAIAGIASFGAKKMIKEPRPYETDARINQLSGGGGYGFPSGHTVEVAAAGTMLCLLWPELVFGFLLFSFCILVMISRVYLGVHDPGEVMAGLFLGSFCSLGTALFLSSVRKPFLQTQILRL